MQAYPIIRSTKFLYPVLPMTFLSEEFVNFIIQITNLELSKTSCNFQQTDRSDQMYNNTQQHHVHKKTSLLFLCHHSYAEWRHYVFTMFRCLSRHLSRAKMDSSAQQVGQPLHTNASVVPQASNDRGRSSALQCYITSRKLTNTNINFSQNSREC